MINWLFPRLLPDELVVSACARFTDHLGYRSAPSLHEDVLGSAAKRLATDLPSYLDRFLARLPPAVRPTIDELIDGHTHFGYFAPFASPERLAQVRLDMRGDRAGTIHSRLDPIDGVSIPETFQFCPACVAHDREQFGEAYWHRAHQLPGVLVCPQHALPLRASDAKTRLRGRLCRSAEGALNSAPIGTPLVASEDELAAYGDDLLAIARETVWLLEQRDLHPGVETFRPRYRFLLHQGGFATNKRIVSWSALSAAFRERYPEPLLTLLGCPPDGAGTIAWLERILRGSRTTQAGHPLHHLLLMRFVGASAAAFFAAEAEPQWFGTGPWPCLNPVSDHYKELRADLHEVRFMNNSTPRGTFICNDCGYAYTRHGPERSPEARYEISRVVDYGPVWLTQLRAMWADPDVPLLKMAKRLHAKPATVKRQAERHGLPPFQRTGKGRPITKLPTRGPAPYDQVHICLPRHQATWRAALAAHPEWTRNELRLNNGHVYMYLQRHAYAWLQAHFPPKQPPPSPPEGFRVDWAKRDAELAATIPAVAATLLSQQDKPIRVTRTGIILTMSQRDTILASLPRLPQTTAALDRWVETQEAWALRRVAWAVENYPSDAKAPSVYCLRLAAKLTIKVAAIPTVRAALEAGSLALKDASLTP